MEFGSVSFLWIYLPFAILVYYLARFLSHNNRSILNAILFILSSIFYVYGGGITNYIIITYIIVSTYLFALWIDCFQGNGQVFANSRKGIFIAAIVIIVLTLCVCKYLDMSKRLWHILTSSTSIISLIVSLLKCGGSGVFPLAISFITFQCISYLADVYKKEITAEKDYLSFSLYNLLFFKLVQGPIMKYSSIKEQLDNSNCSLDSFSYGIGRFCYGLAKKVLIANTLAQVANQAWQIDPKQAGTLTLWVGLIAYTIQIYYDFSGYSDMAIGLGRMFGFNIAENFNYPYTSLSIQEFWRRWHISLSTWFKDYIYIPLGGNRKGTYRTLLNLLIVFFITGLWHGAGLNFIAWGLYFAFFSILERLFLGNILKKNPIKPLNWIYTMLVVMIGWVLFRSANLFDALRYFKYLFILKKPSSSISILSTFNMNVIIIGLVGILLIGWIQRDLMLKHNQSSVIRFIAVLIQMILLILSIFALVNGSYNPSIYANF